MRERRQEEIEQEKENATYRRMKKRRWWQRAYKNSVGNKKGETTKTDEGYEKEYVIE